MMEDTRITYRVTSEDNEKSILNKIKNSVKRFSHLTMFKKSSDDKQNELINCEEHALAKILDDHIQHVESLYVNELNGKISDGINKLAEIGDWANLHRVAEHAEQSSVRACDVENSNFSQHAKESTQVYLELRKYSISQLKDALEYLKSNYGKQRE